MVRTISVVQELNEKVELMNIYTFGRHGYVLERNAGGYRVTRAAGSVDVSPRLQGYHLIQWLEGWLQGVYVGKMAEAYRQIAEGGRVNWELGDAEKVLQEEYTLRADLSKIPVFTKRDAKLDV